MYLKTVNLKAKQSLLQQPNLLVSRNICFYHKTMTYTTKQSQFHLRAVLVIT